METYSHLSDSHSHILILGQPDKTMQGRGCGEDQQGRKEYYDRMYARLQTPKAKRLKKLRSSTVEPVIGTLVNYLAMKRVNTRGIVQANKCMLMAAVAYNLKKLMKWNSIKASTLAKAMEIKAESGKKGLLQVVLLMWLSIHAHSRKTSLTSSRF